VATRTLVGALLFSSPSQTLRLTPPTSALRAARAHGAVLRIYPDLPLRFIKIHGDILVQCIKRIVFILYSQLLSQLEKRECVLETSVGAPTRDCFIWSHCPSTRCM